MNLYKFEGLHRYNVTTLYANVLAETEKEAYKLVNEYGTGERWYIKSKEEPFNMTARVLSMSR